MLAPSHVFRPRLVVATLILVLSLAFPVSPSAQELPDDFGVFVPLDGATYELSGRSARDLTGDMLVVRARRVGLDLVAFEQLGRVLDGGLAPPLVRLNLFEDVVVESLAEHSDVTGTGYSWSGGVEGDPAGSVALAVNGSVLHGIVRTRGRVFKVRRVAGEEYVVSEIDPSRLPPGEPPVRIRRNVDPDPPAQVDDPGRVDIAVFYTAAARQDAGGTDELHALIDAWIADTNGAYARSGIDHRLNLVLKRRVTYTEATNTAEESAAVQALECFRDSSDGCLDLNSVRDEYSADLVHLIISTGLPVNDDAFTCGVAFFTGDFGVSELFCGSDTFAHEIGHNSGVNHDRYTDYDEDCETDSSVSCFDDSPAAYAYGYVNQRGLLSTTPYERRWRTLMSYSDQCVDEDVYCQKLMRFSNPEQEWYDDPLGVSGNRERSSYSSASDAAKTGPANAARVHREFALHLANRKVRTVPDLVVKGFRASPAQVEPGERLQLSAVVENLGISTGSLSETSLSWCRTTASTCSQGNSVGTSALSGSLDAGGRMALSVSVDAPRGTRSHTYRACVSRAPGETLTANNCSDPFVVDVGTVDLQYSIRLSSSSVSGGEPVTLTATVRNRGTIPSSFGRIIFVFLSDPDADPDYLGASAFSALGPGSSQTFDMTVEAPSAAGQYGYYACLSSPHVEWNCDSSVLTVRSSTGGNWRRSGVGNTILDIPSDVRIVRVEGEYTGYSTNFVIWCGYEHDPGGLVVNELLGTGWGQTTYVGVHSAVRNYNRSGDPCRVFHIVSSTGVSWSISETSVSSGLAPPAGTGRWGTDVLAVKEAVLEHRRLIGSRPDGR